MNCPSRRTPARMTRMNAASDQAPIPFCASGVMLLE
jgi:hypothetical protein